MPDLDDYYCIKVDRWGAAGIEEGAGRVHEHALTYDGVRAILNLQLTTLGPGDRAEITLTRGVQHP